MLPPLLVPRFPSCPSLAAKFSILAPAATTSSLLLLLLLLCFEIELSLEGGGTLCCNTSPASARCCPMRRALMRDDLPAPLRAKKGVKKSNEVRVLGFNSRYFKGFTHYPRKTLQELWQQLCMLWLVLAHISTWHTIGTFLRLTCRGHMSVCATPHTNLPTTNNYELQTESITLTR